MAKYNPSAFKVLPIGTGWLSAGCALLVMTLVGCAQKPTKTFTNYDVDVLFLEKTTREPLRVTPETMIIDTRSHFDYALAHAPRSINLNWTFFTNRSAPFEGVLKANLSDEVRRLALMGLSLQTPIIVAGPGINGNGEDGRLAWTLIYLGFQNVQTAEFNSLGLRFTNVQSSPVPNARQWDIDTRASVLADRTEVLRAAANQNDGKIHLLDVRSKEEYFSKNKSLQYDTPDLRTIHMEWQNFFTAQGRPNLSMKKKLAELQIHPNDRVIVISQKGVRSGAVTYALLAMGYKKAANYVGGYQELIGRKR